MADKQKIKKRLEEIDQQRKQLDNKAKRDRQALRKEERKLADWRARLIGYAVLKDATKNGRVAHYLRHIVDRQTGRDREPFDDADWEMPSPENEEQADGDRLAENRAQAGESSSSSEAEQQPEGEGAQA